MPWVLLCALFLTALTAIDADATPRRPDYCQTCSRDDHGKIKRSESAKRRFMRESGYPNGRPGYHIDHIVPLACGGADSPSNMQWLSLPDKRTKDRVERKNCTR